PHPTGRRGTQGDVVGQGWRADADDDAQGGAGAGDRDEPLDPSPRPAVGVPAAARRAGAVDLRPERGRESLRGAHVALRAGAETAERAEIAEISGFARRSSLPPRSPRGGCTSIQSLQ